MQFFREKHAVFSVSWRPCFFVKPTQKEVCEATTPFGRTKAEPLECGWPITTNNAGVRLPDSVCFQGMSFLLLVHLMSVLLGQPL